MKDFFKMLAASFLGCALVFFIGTFFILGVISALATFGASQTGTIPNRSILRITFEKPLLEQNSENPVSKMIPFNLYEDDGHGFYELVSAIDRAAADSRIEMIYLNTNYLKAGISHIEEVRNALKRFRATGKPVIAYSDSYSQAGYYLASIADKIYLNPHGQISLRGFALSIRYYKALFDELGIEAQLIRHGKYKSGGESYVDRQMSPEERDQLDSYLKSAWGHWAEEISQTRDVPLALLNEIAENQGCFTIQDATDANLIDNALYKDELVEQLCKLQGVTAEKQLRVAAMDTYIANKPLNKAKDKIAVLFANGELYTGAGQKDIMTENYSRMITRLRADSSVKAVVLRVNSPGGDARAAAIIHHELQLLKQVKPLIISIGDEAASGGYWMACAGDCIFSSPTSITGSIGAYAITYNGQKGINKWLKINVETVRTHSSSDAGSLYRPLSGREFNRIQEEIDDTYNHFVETVSRDRSLSADKTETLAQGRIWSGADAQQNGLTDRTGGLSDAIAYAADIASLISYQIVEYPSTSSIFERIMQSVSSESRASLPGTPQKWADEIERSVENIAKQGIQARMQYIYRLDYQ